MAKKVSSWDLFFTLSLTDKSFSTDSLQCEFLLGHAVVSTPVLCSGGNTLLCSIGKRKKVHPCFSVGMCLIILASQVLHSAAGFAEDKFITCYDVWLPLQSILPMGVTLHIDSTSANFSALSTGYTTWTASAR